MLKIKPRFKIIVINNDKPIRKSIDLIFEQNGYKNHLDYWKDYLMHKKFETVAFNNIYSDNRDIIGIKICMEGNIVFIDASNPNSEYKNGFIYLPSNVKTTRKKLIKFLTSNYDYLTVVSDIKYNNGRPIGKYSTIEKTKKDYSKKKIINR